MADSTAVFKEIQVYMEITGLRVLGYVDVDDDTIMEEAEEILESVEAKNEIKGKVKSEPESDERQALRTLPAADVPPGSLPTVGEEADTIEQGHRAEHAAKHEKRKRHSRPGKCSVVNCRFHEYGFPSEKELKRHRNDKKSVKPKLFKCLFPPCAYSSSRESTCKQHMEKAHKWLYVRPEKNSNLFDRAVRTGVESNRSTF